MAKEKLFGAATATEIEYNYDQAGNLIEITYPDGDVIEITPDELGRIDTITDDSGTPYTYAEYTYIGSRVAKRTYPLGANDDVDYVISYNDLGQAEILDTYQDTTTIAKFEYSFDDNGNITAQEFAHRIASPDNDYTYDDLDRLTQVDYHDSEDEQFTYDKLGNRENVNLRDGTDQDYAINYSTNRYDNDAGEDIVCDYDDAGNTTVDPNGYQYTYDYENRLTQILDDANDVVANFAYDALGRRIEVHDVVANPNTRYYNNNWQVLSEYDDNNTYLRSYIYGSDVVASTLNRTLPGLASMFGYRQDFNRKGSCGPIDEVLVKL
ncbi:hypothetical protein ACFL02_06030 [Planctomycetota bacterium]